MLAFLVLLADLLDLQVCTFPLAPTKQVDIETVCRTRRKRLLELLGLVVVLKDEGVQVARASDLELGQVGGLVLLDTRGYCFFFKSEMNPYLLIGVASSRYLVTYTERPCGGRSQ